MEMPGGFEDLQNRLLNGQIGRCTCDTKTPEIRYHADECAYRLCAEAHGMLQVLGNVVAAVREPPPDSETVRRQLVHEIHAEISTRFNDALVEMKVGSDDSVCGFNDAWDIVRALFKKRLGR